MSTTRKIKKGQMLFAEGDKSNAMYFIQNGTLRLFKKKGAGSIEIGLIHKGEVVGEMGFLDGGPRSASAEAMYDTELVEVNTQQMVDQMKSLPQWLMVMLKTIVNRLRSANNKIRQLESAGVSLNYGGDSVAQYEFLNSHDVLKVLAAVILCASRSTEVNGTTAKIGMSKIMKYANQIAGVGQAKVSEMIDLLERIGVAKIDRSNLENVLVYINDANYLEQFMNFLADENVKDNTKKIKLSVKAIAILGYMGKHQALFPAAADGVSEFNLAKIIELEKAANGGKEPFRLDEMIELVKHGICTEAKLKDSATAVTRARTSEIIKMFRFMKTLKELEALNESKRGNAAKGVATTSKGGH